MFTSLPEDIVNYILSFIFFSYDKLIECKHIQNIDSKCLFNEMKNYVNISRTSRSMNMLCSSESYLFNIYSYFIQQLIKKNGSHFHCKTTLPVDIIDSVVPNFTTVEQIRKDMISKERCIISFYSNSSLILYDAIDLLAYLTWQTYIKKC